MFPALRRAGICLAVLTIALLMANAHCYLRCSMAQADDTHCHQSGTRGGPACADQHAISKQAVPNASALDYSASPIATIAAAFGAVSAIGVASQHVSPPRTERLDLPLRI